MPSAAATGLDTFKWCDHSPLVRMQGSSAAHKRLYLASSLEVVGVDPVDAKIKHGLPDLVARKPRPTGESKEGSRQPQPRESAVILTTHPGVSQNRLGMPLSRLI